MKKIKAIILVLLFVAFIWLGDITIPTVFSLLPNPVFYTLQSAVIIFGILIIVFMYFALASAIVKDVRDWFRRGGLSKEEYKHNQEMKARWEERRKMRHDTKSSVYDQDEYYGRENEK
jgi:hypothetical protein